MSGWVENDGGDVSFTCRVCSQEGHKVAECPEKPAMICFNCGEEGHSKADCLNPRKMICRHCTKEGHTVARCPEPDCPPQEPREFTGECRICNQEGHRAADCPERPPPTCNNCKEEGHAAVDCKNPRKINRDDIEDMNADAAWDMIIAAAKEQDMDDVKDGIQKYLKSQPDMTYETLETSFRNQEIPVYIIALEKPQLLSSITNMDLQGNLNKKYQVTFRFSALALRPREAVYWPKDAADNLKRLKDAGEPVTRGLIKCMNCSHLGHAKKDCPDDVVEKEHVVIRCFNCQEEGHRVRDCPTPRVDKFACRNCGGQGHKSQECTEPPNMDLVECRKCEKNGHFSRDCPEGGGNLCRNCGQPGHRAKDCTEERKIICRNCDGEGHQSRDCPEPRNMEKVQCRNCDEYGHDSRGCPKPRDYSRVTCQNCQQTGHTKVRCPNPTAADGADPPVREDGGAAHSVDDFSSGGAAAEVDTGGDVGGW